MPVEFSHFEGDARSGVIKSTYASIVRRFTGRSAHAVLVVKPDPDPEPRPESGKASLFNRRQVRGA